jgi:large subunit ribosomal protein L10
MKTKEEKDQIIEALVEKFSAYNNFYITDVSSLTVEKTNELRRLCFSRGIKMHVAKNTLIRKALERTGTTDYEGLFETLKGSTAILFSETGNAPAKLIKEFRRKSDRPLLKSAYLASDIYIGDKQLDALASIKSKNELIADIVALLQSPARNIVSALQNHAEKKGGETTE